MTVAKDKGPYNFNLLVHQWPTRVAEARAQEPLLVWIRGGKLSAGDFLTGEYALGDVAEALRVTQEPLSIKTLLRF